MDVDLVHLIVFVVGAAIFLLARMDSQDVRRILTQTFALVIIGITFALVGYEIYQAGIWTALVIFVLPVLFDVWLLKSVVTDLWSEYKEYKRRNLEKQESEAKEIYFRELSEEGRSQVKAKALEWYSSNPRSTARGLHTHDDEIALHYIRWCQKRKKQFI